LQKKIKYQSAGTVEFLFDDKTGEFWFLEVNTRLQVEHPVTEEVTGMDLVYEQLRIARGEELGYEQDDVSWIGHSIEARLYAEDPSNDFLPETGTLIAFEEDPHAEARWDTGVESGSIVGTSFDPMLAKVISYGATRTDAASKLARALEAAHIGGLTTNRDFLVATLKTKEFLDGDTTTDFITRVKPPRSLELSEEQIKHVTSIAALWIQELNRLNDHVLGHLPSGWTNGRTPKQNIKFKYKDEEINVVYKLQRDGSYNMHESSIAFIYECYEDGIDLEFNGRRHFSKVTLQENMILIHMPFGDILLEILPRFIVPGLELQTGGLVAPMPGKVIDLKVKKGSKVKAGDTLVILEAMKMEHSIRASEDGVITELFVSGNDQVENGALLMVLDSD
jgi:propionyl-CoA carboxylase alpha chain